MMHKNTCAAISPDIYLSFTKYMWGFHKKPSFLLFFFLLHAASEMYLCIILCIVFLDMAHPLIPIFLHIYMY